MRLFLFPISTRNALAYCPKVPQKASGKLSLADRATHKISSTWAGWEKEEKGWKKQITLYGEAALRRIPYQEWGLKSIPPLSNAQKKAILETPTKVEVHFPSLFLPENRIEGLLRTLATERRGLHRKRLIWSIIGMPITVPFMLVPM